MLSETGLQAGYHMFTQVTTCNPTMFGNEMNVF